MAEDENTSSKTRVPKSLRLPQEAIDTLEALKQATDIGSEADLTTFALRYVKQTLLPLLISSPRLSRALLEEITGVVGIIRAFFVEAERAMREEGADDKAIETLGTDVLSHFPDPVYVTALLMEQIGEREVWLRYSTRNYYQYKQAHEILERSGMEIRDRYASSSHPDPESDEEALEPSIRLYPDDIYAVYEECVLIGRTPEEEAALFSGLRQSLQTYLPHLRSKKRKKEEAHDTESRSTLLS